MNYNKYLIESFGDKIKAWENVDELYCDGEYVYLNGIKMTLSGIMDGYITILKIQIEQLIKEENNNG